MNKLSFKSWITPAIISFCCLSIAASENSYAGKKKKQAKVNAPEAKSGQKASASKLNLSDTKISARFGPALTSVRELLDDQRMVIYWPRLMPLLLSLIRQDEREKFAANLSLSIYEGQQNTQIFDKIVELLVQLNAEGKVIYAIRKNDVNTTIYKNRPELFFQIMIVQMMTAYLNYDSLNGQLDSEDRTYNPALQRLTQQVNRIFQDFLDSATYTPPVFNYHHADLQDVITAYEDFLSLPFQDYSWLDDYIWEDTNVMLSTYVREFLFEFFDDQASKVSPPSARDESSYEADEEQEASDTPNYESIFRNIRIPRTTSMAIFLASLEGQVNQHDPNMHLQILLALLKMDFAESTYSDASEQEHRLSALHNLRQLYAQLIYSHFWPTATTEAKFKILYFFAFVLGFDFVQQLDHEQQAQVIGDLYSLNAEPPPYQVMPPQMMGIQQPGTDGGLNPVMMMFTTLQVAGSSGGYGMGAAPFSGRIPARHAGRFSGGGGGGGGASVMTGAQAQPYSNPGAGTTPFASGGHHNGGYEHLPQSGRSDSGRKRNEGRNGEHQNTRDQMPKLEPYDTPDTQPQEQHQPYQPDFTAHPPIGSTGQPAGYAGGASSSPSEDAYLDQPVGSYPEIVTALSNAGISLPGWQNFASYLHLSEADQEEIRDDYRNTEKRREITITKWMQSQARNATWRVLAQVFESLRRNDIAITLREYALKKHSRNH